MGEASMRRFWDQRARENALYFVDSRVAYDDPDVDRFWADGEAVVESLSREMGFRIEPTDTLLDIGCGVGRMTRPLAARAGSVVGLDVSQEMLARARELNPGLDNAEWVLGDGTSLAGIEDASLDGCFSIVVFQHMPDPALTLGYVREIGRVLKPGGWAAIQVSNDPTVHRSAGTPLGWRLRALLGRAPRGQGNPAWLGSSVELPELGAAASEAGLAVRGTWGEGTLFCRVMLQKRTGAS